MGPEVVPLHKVVWKVKEWLMGMMLPRTRYRYLVEIKDLKMFTNSNDTAMRVWGSLHQLYKTDPACHPIGWPTGSSL